MTTTTMTPSKPAWARGAILAGGGLALAGVGLAAGLMLGTPEPAAEPARIAEAAAVTAPAAAATPAPAAAPAPKAAAKPERPPVASRAPAAAGTGSAGAHRATPLETQHAAETVCAHCGVVESVRAFEKKGEGSGIGAVAGGVIGGALGNQVGKGNGRAAMTVIGAVGGGMAGHEIEKRAKAETMYEVRVRMEDGTLRTVTQKSPPATGSRVVVEGSTLRSADSGTGEPRMMRTAARQQGV